MGGEGRTQLQYIKIKRKTIYKNEKEEGNKNEYMVCFAWLS